MLFMGTWIFLCVPWCVEGSEHGLHGLHGLLLWGRGYSLEFRGA